MAEKKFRSQAQTIVYHAFMHRVAYEPEHLTKIVRSHPVAISTLNGMEIIIMARKVHALSTGNGESMDDNDTNQEIIHLLEIHKTDREE